MEKLNVFSGLLSSWVFVMVMASTVAFQVIIVEFLGTFASTVPLTWRMWATSIAIGSLSMIVALILKSIPVESNATHVSHSGYEPIPSGPDAV